MNPIGCQMAFMGTKQCTPTSSSSLAHIVHHTCALMCLSVRCWSHVNDFPFVVRASARGRHLHDPNECKARLVVLLSSRRSYIEKFPFICFRLDRQRWCGVRLTIFRFQCEKNIEKKNSICL